MRERQPGRRRRDPGGHDARRTSGPRLARQRARRAVLGNLAHVPDRQHGRAVDQSGA